MTGMMLLSLKNCFRDANRLMKGQDVPYLGGEKGQILASFEIQKGGPHHAFLYDRVSNEDNRNPRNGQDMEE